MARKRRKSKSSISSRYRSRKQTGGVLSRYDFAYAGRDSVNQAACRVKKIDPELINKTFDRAIDFAPQVIRKASRELDAIAARRINQFTYNTGREVQRIAPGLIKRAIEELYKTPFRLLGQFGRNKHNQLKTRLYKTLKLKKARYRKRRRYLWL